MARPPHKATTANFEAVYPFQVEQSLGSDGIYIGRGSYGNAFVFDPWELYMQNVITNPNIMILGEIGSGKTSLVKTLVYRAQVMRDRRAVIIDPKGEYSNLAEAMGGSVLKLSPRGDMRLNPLQAPPGEEGAATQLALLLAVIAAALERPLSPEEAAAATQALQVANEAAGDHPPVIRDVVELMLKPNVVMTKALATTKSALAVGARDAALALMQLCEGPLAGMFDGRTSASVNFDASVIVLDLSAVYTSQALGILMACAAAWLDAEIARQVQSGDQMRNYWIFDEGWHVAGHEGVGEWLRARYKLVRKYGLSNVMVLHRLSDLSAAGAAGSRAERLAKGLLADTGTRIIYRQTEGEAELLKSTFDLSQMQLAVTLRAVSGEALWIVGSRRFNVMHDLSPLERQLVDSDGAMGHRQGFEEVANV